MMLNTCNFNLNDISKISEYMFFLNQHIENVIIPDTVTCVESCAFAKCFNLKSIIFNRHCKLIGSAICIRCFNLINVKLPYDEILPIEMFERCHKLNIIDLNNSFKIIKKNAFSYCFNLSTIIGTHQVEIIEEGAFYNSGLKTIRFSDKLKKISKNSFSKCSSLEKIELPYSNTNVQIDEHAFDECLNFKGIQFYE